MRLCRPWVTWTRVVLGAAAMLVLHSTPAEAANCSVSVTPVSFGTYDVFGVAPTDSTGIVTFSCNNATPVMISLSRGASPSFEPRTLTAGANRLSYNLFLNAARTLVWGDGTGGTGVYSDVTVKNVAVTVTCYGRIPPNQDVSAGAYADTIVATINF